MIEQTKIIYCEQAGDGGDVISTETETPSAMAVFSGGQDSNIDSIFYDTGGVSTNFGALINFSYGGAGTGNDTIALMGYSENYGYENVIDTMELATTNSVSVFGNVDIGARYPIACSDRNNSALWSGGYDGDYGWLNRVEHTEISSFVFTAQWGTLSTTKENAVAISNDVTAIIGGGWNSSAVRTLDGFVYSTGGTATYYGDLITDHGNVGSGGTEVNSEGIFAGGNDQFEGTQTDFIDKRDFDSGSNVTSWGTLGDYTANVRATSNQTTTALFAADYSNIDQDIILSLDTATDTTASNFGNTSSNRGYGGYTSSGIGTKITTPDPDPDPTDCEDTTVFQLHSYITFNHIDFDSNMDNVLLWEGMNNDVDITVNNSTSTDQLNISIDNIKSLTINDSVFNTGTHYILSDISNINVDSLILNTYGSYFTDESDIMSIDKSNIFNIGLTINVTRDDTDLNLTGINISDSFVNQMDIVHNTLFGYVPPEPAVWIYATTSDSLSMAIRDDGTLWGSGTDIYNVFGIDEVTTNQTTFKQLGTDTDWAIVETSDTCALAIKTDGTLWGTGLNNDGELGQGHLQSISYWVPVGTDTDWVDISFGQHHALALKSDGSMYVCGSNSTGQCGEAESSGLHLEFEDVTGYDDWVAISASPDGNTSMGIRNNGYGNVLYATGANDYGMFGVYGESSPYWAFTRVTYFETFNEIQLQSNTTMAIIETGYGNILHSAGRGELGNLGNDSTLNQSEFIEEDNDFDDWVILGSALNTGYGIRTNGTLWGTGYNYYGLLGQGHTTDLSIYTQIGTDANWAFITKGGSQSALFIKTNGTMWALGNNSNGELGIGELSVSGISTLTQVVDS